ncbi:hypothetical protein BDS110ZK12_78300 [Bradyrhizobium diazoefficiens]|uniref:Uncharacterized protein n=1 Tax=Bradyrhizobium diazoefficiens TaxID=1355477 RepID=A0A810BSP8_9BRAD|nr:hypothetical protein XF8B_85310 [Bradyrhizobium diazoefficiens]
MLFAANPTPTKPQKAQDNLVEDSWPTWLKIMENGAVGEARTRSFLIDRFWVLERSVDTDGADFLIQRRTTTQRFTDRVPPRVGVIQAKYFQDRRTTHYIPKSYVVDDKGMPLEGFFALLHVGREDDGEMYLLSARQIVNTLSISSTHSPESYVVGTTALQGTFRINARKLALDQIEHSLKSQTYYQSAAFLDKLNIPYRRFSEDDIDFPWTLPLPNPVGEIPKMFVEQKEELRKIVFDMEEVLGAIDAVLTEKDPRRALELMDALRYHVDGYGRITFGGRGDFNWGDFPDALDTHDRWRQGLQTDGLLEPYIAMGDKLQVALVSHTAAHPLTDKGSFLQAIIEYDRDTLNVIELSVKSGTAAEREPEIKTPGHVRMASSLGEWVPRKIKPMDYTIENVWWNVMRYVIEERYPDPHFD